MKTYDEGERTMIEASANDDDPTWPDEKARAQKKGELLLGVENLFFN